MNIFPYLYFGSKCDEAIAFYRESLGATCPVLMRFKDAPPDMKCDPSMAERVMHAELRIGSSIVMVSDGRGDECKFDGFGLTLNVGSAAEAVEKFNALAAGGAIAHPLQKTFFAENFGMVKDRYGISWLVVHTA